MVTNGHKISYQNEINLSDRSFSLPWKPMKREQNFNLPTKGFDKGTHAASRYPTTSVSVSENLLGEVSCSSVRLNSMPQRI